MFEYRALLLKTISMSSGNKFNGNNFLSGINRPIIPE
jgi:hypothetical protein